jgi:mono/diheme cytochrome c family protein
MNIGTFVQNRVVRATAVVVLCGALTPFGLSADPKPAPVDPDHAAKMTRGLEVFKKQVRAILADRCLKCHGGKRTEGEFDLVDRASMLKGGAAGPAIIPGRGKDSLLIKLVNHQKEPKMPHNTAKMSEAEIAALASWIDLGAPYDAPLVGGVAKGPKWTEKVVDAEARKFWSFQPLKKVEPPAVQDAAWCKTSADRFILAKLEAAHLKPNPAADKRTLIRRASFDLTGLPPAPEDVAKFLNDTTPEAYERMIDGLLASPRYGERWGRHWLDLARFAESHGFEHDYDRPTAYHYRDFVIEALNQDLPFDTFVKWQLAGDEIAPDNNLALKATGFLAAGVHSTQITKNEVEKHRYDEMDDMLATASTAFLGLTIGCARCHDHKFDPVPQRDYYRLLATFTTTIRSEVDLDLDAEGYKKAKAAFDREHEPFTAAVAKFEAEQLPSRLAAWEKTQGSRQIGDFWQTLDIATHTSRGGATITKLPDSSLRVTGKNEAFDSYTFTAQTDLTKITGVRLEALADPSLVKGGPGRASNGNFALTNFTVTAKSLADKNAKPVTLKLKNARATFEQKGLPIAAAIDADPKSAWAIDPQFGKDHAAVFEVDGDVGFPSGTLLTFKLDFSNNAQHNLGRPRLAVTTSPKLDLTAPGVPRMVHTILQTPADKRTLEQTEILLQWYRFIDADWRAVNKPAEEHLQKSPKPSKVKAMISSEGLAAVRLHSQGEDYLKETHFLKRGDAGQKEGLATQSFLQVLMPADGEKRWQQQPPAGWRTSYRRRAFADWLTDVDHGAGRLLARVIVNRLWQHHLGRGIVATPSDFGTRGELPTHPELLDWLAGQLIQNGWKLKPMHKLIMMTAAYQQSARLDPAKLKADVENKLLWRRPRTRLQAEVVRDALLAVGGTLDTKMYGPGTLDPNTRRRSIYFTVKRSQLVSMMTVFDAPDALAGVGDRPTTTIAPQALLLMNNPQVRASAKAFAHRVAPDSKTPLEEAVKAGYEIALTRAPDADELAESVAFVKRQMESYKATGKSDAREMALADFCQALVCLNEFVYVD